MGCARTGNGEAPANGLAIARAAVSMMVSTLPMKALQSLLGPSQTRALRGFAPTTTVDPALAASASLSSVERTELKK
jgi:hypothetical protein